MALTLHKKEVLSVAYDSQSGKYCVTTAKDQNMIIYLLDNYYKQAKPLIIKEITSFQDMTLSSLAVVDKFASQKPVAYVAIADGTTFEVFAGIISDNEIKNMVSVIRVSEAQSDTIQ